MGFEQSIYAEVEKSRILEMYSDTKEIVFVFGSSMDEMEMKHVSKSSSFFSYGQCLLALVV